MGNVTFNVWFSNTMNRTYRGSGNIALGGSTLKKRGADRKLDWHAQYGLADHVLSVRNSNAAATTTHILIAHL
jgi:hypothetical protein